MAQNRNCWDTRRQLAPFPGQPENSIIFRSTQKRSGYETRSLNTVCQLHSFLFNQTTSILLMAEKHTSYSHSEETYKSTSAAPSTYNASTSTSVTGTSHAPVYTQRESYTTQHTSRHPPGQSVTQDAVGAAKEVGHKRMLTNI
jgi:hypothetical protein